MRTQAGAVACGHEVTAAAAVEVLEQGGNAFDATLAAIAASCVAEPVLCSLGGGGYLLAHRSGEPPLVYDFFPDTPLEPLDWNRVDLHPVQADFGTATQEFHVGLGAVATPGVPAGLFEIHRELCTLPVERLFEPAVTAARDGVIVNPLQAYIFQVVAPIYLATPGARKIFGENRDSLPREGRCFRQPELADTLLRLAREGPGLMYTGELGRRLVAECAAHGGQLRDEDLGRYLVERRAPLELEYRGARVLTNPPPSRGGILVAFALALLQELELSDRPGWLRALVEAMRLTNLARIESDEPLLEPGLLHRYREELRGRPGFNRGTTHISVIDGAGNLAAATLSNGEGCGHVLPGSGVMLNNMLGEADINPGGLQRWRPGTRMASMMAPTLLEQGERLAVLGSGGSNRIRSAILQVLSNLVDFQMPAQQAVEAPRIHVEDDLVSIEGGFSDEERRAVEESGLRVDCWPGRSLFFGGVHVAIRDGDHFSASGDPRRGGVGTVLRNGPAAS